MTSSGSSGHVGDTRPGQTRKKPKDLSEEELIVDKIVLNCLFIINGENESYKEDQYRIVGVMKDEEVKLKSSTRLV